MKSFFKNPWTVFAVCELLLFVALFFAGPPWVKYICLLFSFVPVIVLYVLTAKNGKELGCLFGCIALILNIFLSIVVLDFNLNASVITVSDKDSYGTSYVPYYKGFTAVSPSGQKVVHPLERGHVYLYNESDRELYRYDVTYDEYPYSSLGGHGRTHCDPFAPGSFTDIDRMPSYILEDPPKSITVREKAKSERKSTTRSVLSFDHP